MYGRRRQGAETRGEGKKQTGPESEHNVQRAVDADQRALSQAALRLDLEGGKASGHMLYAGTWGAMREAEDQQGFVK